MKFGEQVDYRLNFGSDLEHILDRLLLSLIFFNCTIQHTSAASKTWHHFNVAWQRYAAY